MRLLLGPRAVHCKSLAPALSRSRPLAPNCVNRLCHCILGVRSVVSHLWPPNLRFSVGPSGRVRRARGCLGAVPTHLPMVRTAFPDASGERIAWVVALLFLASRVRVRRASPTEFPQSPGICPAPRAQVIQQIAWAERTALLFLCAPPFLGFRWDDRLRCVAANLKGRQLPASWPTQTASFLLLSCEVTRSIELLERSRAESRLDSPHSFGIGLELPHKVLDVGVTHVKPTRHGALRPLPRISGVRPLPCKLLYNAGFFEAPPRARRVRPCRALFQDFEVMPLWTALPLFLRAD